MKRKLTLAIWLSLSAGSPQALALGLGEAEVRSTLNAPLRASIPLTDTAGLQAGLLNVSVADERAFAAAGLTRTPLAASVRMAVVQRQGQLVLDLTTEGAVREPWLDLLLRFDWPDGRQMREVTLLLDPPDYDRMPVLVAGDAPPTRAAAPAPRQAPAERAVVRPALTPAAPSGNPAWVRSGDTLWAVAGRLRPDSGISMNQMMVALVEANPAAFPTGNINTMRAGVTLVVPERAALAARPRPEADRIVQAMNQAWANRGSGAPARVPLDATPPAVETGVARGPSEASGEAPGASSETEPSADETPEDAVTQDAAPAEVVGEVEAPHLTLLTDEEIAAEAAAATEAEGEAGGSEAPEELPVDGAEAIAEAETAVEAPADESVTGAPGDTASPALAREGGEVTEDERLASLEARWRESRQALEAMQAERDQLQEELGGMREELAALREQLALMMAGGAGSDAAGTGGVVAPGTSGEGEVEAPWWGALYQGGLDRNLMLGGAGLAALLALWLVVRRRGRREQAEEGRFGELRVVRPGAREAAASTMASAAEAPPESRRATVPLAEAINEADIFIAYGRLDQARELLEASLAREPERDDLRLKLLGVNLQQGDREAADRQAAALRAGGDPARLAELEQLLAHHRQGPGEPTVAAAPGAGGGEGPAVFTPPAEHPPRRFDETPPVAEPAPGVPGAEPASDEERPVVSPGRGDGEVPPVAPAAGSENLSAASGEAPTEPDAVPPLAQRRDGGSRIIDYRPPTLEPAPSSREESPQQPSVEFTPSPAPDEGEAAAAPPGDAPEEWELEEVAFPPLDRDNVGSSTDASSDGALAKARQLLDAGERDRARTLLEALVVHVEPSVREEARALLSRLEP